MVPPVETTAMRGGEVKTLLRDDSAGRVDRKRVLADHCQDRKVRVNFRFKATVLHDAG